LNSRPYIAIVDDDPAIRGSLDSLLRSAGIASCCFEGGEELLASGQGATLTCIVTDLHMPGMNGLELQIELARRGWSQPVIVMTAFPSAAAREQALAAGAVTMLVKPIDPDRLLDAIARITN